jgi:uncharacterized protein YjiS (DUF1127 family)
MPAIAFAKAFRMTSMSFNQRLQTWRARRDFRRRYRSAMAILQAMTSRDLLDIGISCGDFPEIAADMAPR